MDHIGVHVPRRPNKTMEQSIQITKKELDFSKMKVCQIFVAEPSGYSRFIKNNQEDSFLTFVNRSGMSIFAHARYLDTPFSTNVSQSTLTYIRNEVALCGRVGIMGFIIHLYRYQPSIVVDVLKRLELDSKVKIILETPATSPDKAIYNSPQALYDLYSMTSKSKLNCGICVDTCHIYSSGLNITDLEVMQDFFSELIRLIPVKDIIIHLNDSNASLGSGIDRHATIGKGQIWRKKTASLEWLLRFIKKYKIITILERNEGNGNLVQDLECIKGLI